MRRTGFDFNASTPGVAIHSSQNEPEGGKNSSITTHRDGRPIRALVFKDIRGRGHVPDRRRDGHGLLTRFYVDGGAHFGRGVSVRRDAPVFALAETKKQATAASRLPTKKSIPSSHKLNNRRGASGQARHHLPDARHVLRNKTAGGSSGRDKEGKKMETRMPGECDAGLSEKKRR